MPAKSTKGRYILIYIMYWQCNGHGVIKYKLTEDDYLQKNNDLGNLSTWVARAIEQLDTINERR